MNSWQDSAEILKGWPFFTQIFVNTQKLTEVYGNYQARCKTLLNQEQQEQEVRTIAINIKLKQEETLCQKRPKFSCFALCDFFHDFDNLLLDLV